VVGKLEGKKHAPDKEEGKKLKNYLAARKGKKRGRDKTQ